MPETLPLLASVHSRREGWLKINFIVVLILLAAITGILCVLWEVLMLNVVDRDWRDMLFDHRINHGARAANHAFFRTVWASLQALPSTAATARIAAAGVPVLQLECKDPASTLCQEANADVEEALGINPVWNGIVAEKLQTDSITLSVTLTPSDTQPWPKLVQSGANYTGGAVTTFVETVKERYGNDRWVSPNHYAWPAIHGRLPTYKAVTTRGQNRRKWGINNDLNWFGTCPDTDWDATFFLAYPWVHFPAHQPERTQELDVSLDGITTYVPFFKPPDLQGNSSVQKLSRIVLHVAMVLPTPCHPWRISAVDSEYESFTEPMTSREALVEVVVQDASQPEQLQLPSYRGQVFFFVAIFCGCLAVVGSALLALLWAVVVWNVSVLNGLDMPVWAPQSTRGW